MTLFLICCIYKKGYKIAQSIYSITNSIYEYASIDEMINIIKNIVDMESKK